MEQFEVVFATLGGFESSLNNFHLSPDIDEGFRVSGSRNSRVFEVGKHEIKFGAQEEIYTFLEMPGVSPPMFLGQGIPFYYGIGLCFGEIEYEYIPEFLF